MVEAVGAGEILRDAIPVLVHESEDVAGDHIPAVAGGLIQTLGTLSYDHTGQQDQKASQDQGATAHVWLLHYSLSSDESDRSGWLRLRVHRIAVRVESAGVHSAAANGQRSRRQCEWSSRGGRCSIRLRCGTQVGDMLA